MQVFTQGKLQQMDAVPAADVPAVFFIRAEEAARMPALGPVFAELPALAEGGTRFESHRGFDYISLNVPDPKDCMAPQRHGSIYFTGKQLVFVCEEMPALQGLLADLAKWEEEAPAPERVLYLFFSHLLSKDPEALGDMEEEISGLEDRIVGEKDENFTREISRLRKRLLVLKRYYEALFDLLQDLEENQNGLISKGQLHYFRIHTNRADRLSHSVLNLRDYVTQVRESYQNQLDISLNETMKLFTVITAVFLPLTLITGWYGMNVHMPEVAFKITYPIIIVVCVAVAVGCLWYFKRHKWF